MYTHKRVFLCEIIKLLLLISTTDKHFINNSHSKVHLLPDESTYERHLKSKFVFLKKYKKHGKMKKKIIFSLTYIFIFQYNLQPYQYTCRSIRTAFQCPVFRATVLGAAFFNFNILMKRSPRLKSLSQINEYWRCQKPHKFCITREERQHTLLWTRRTLLNNKWGHFSFMTGF